MPIITDPGPSDDNPMTVESIAKLYEQDSTASKSVTDFESSKHGWSIVEARNQDLATTSTCNLGR